jgi:hypothetical protein
MKALFATSLVCSVASLFALAGLSAMTVAPGAETWRMEMMLVVAVFMVAWLGLAVWAWRRLRTPAGAGVPSWLGRTLVIAGALYALLVLLVWVG